MKNADLDDKELGMIEKVKRNRLAVQERMKKQQEEKEKVEKEKKDVPQTE